MPLFDIDTLVTLKAVNVSEQKEPHLEDHFSNEKTALLTVIAFLGTESSYAFSPINISLEDKYKLIAKVLGMTLYSKAKKHLSWFVTYNAKRIKRDWNIMTTKNNHLEEEEFLQILVVGSTILYDRMGSFQKIGELRTKIYSVLTGNYTKKVKFSDLPRYILNGRGSKDWYKDNLESMKRLLPEFDPVLMCQLFSATSIRNHVSGNVIKFFRALLQFYDPVTRKVALGKNGSKKVIDSKFSGYVDATVYQLQQIYQLTHNPEVVDQQKRKTKNFAQAMYNNENAVVVDIWLMRAFDCDIRYKYKGVLESRSPTKSLYDCIEKYFQVVAPILGLKAREISSMTWGGIRREMYKNGSLVDYSPFMKKKLNHGLFSDQFGKLKLGENGVFFEVLE